MAPASIPANIGEVLYVSLSHVLDFIEEHGEYPERMRLNMRKVLAAYNRDRAKALAKQGRSGEDIARYTALAAESLARWLDNQAKKQEANDEDFERWAEELSSDRENDPRGEG